MTPTFDNSTYNEITGIKQGGGLIYWKRKQNPNAIIADTTSGFTERVTVGTRRHAQTM